MSSDPFNSSFMERLKQASKTDNLDAAANALFGQTVDKYSDEFKDIKQDLKEADMDVLYRTYMSKTFMFTIFAGLLGGILGATYSILNQVSLVMGIRITIGAPLAFSLLVFGFMYMYPSQKASKRKKNIDENLPFALNHLGAIATRQVEALRHTSTRRQMRPYSITT